MNNKKQTETRLAENSKVQKSELQHSLPAVVETAFSNYPESVRATLLRARALLLSVKENDPEIGEINETLRWGELSFLTEKPKTGSMIRLAMTKSGQPALFFHCGTTLVERFRAQYAHLFEFEDNRALVLTQPVDETGTELKHCISQALRYNID